MNNMYDVLEVCLQEIENGADVETLLFRYPEYADELRPILATAAQAKSAAVPDPSTDMLRRNRAKVLQQAAQMREAQALPARRLWSVPLRRVLVSLAVIAVLFMSTNQLVHASSGTLPGDNLYPVKRTWEDLRLLFTFDTQARAALEVEHENERLSELNELFAEGRSVEVKFTGVITSQNGNQWVVSSFPVLIVPGTEMDAQPVKVGDAVRIKGHTQPDGTIQAERVELLPAGMPMPTVGDEQESETEQAKPDDHQESEEEGPSNKSGSPTPVIKATETAEEEKRVEKSSLDGVVDSVNGTSLVVNGTSMNISGAEIKGTPTVGAVAKVEGYYDANGVFIVTKIEFQSSGSDQKDSSSSGGSNDNGSDDNSGSGSGGDDGGGDDSGGSGSSGSGGGGDD